MHIGFMIEDDFLTLGGQLAIVEPNEESNYDPAKADISILHFDRKMVGFIKKQYYFLDIEKLSLDKSENSGTYLLMGFPESLTNKHYPTKTINPKSLRVRTIGASIDFYLANNIDPQKTLVLTLDQISERAIHSEDNSRLPKELGGISGCGIWAILDINSQNPRYQLVSIVTGEDENKSVIYSTKVAMLPEIMKTYFKINLR